MSTTQATTKNFYPVKLTEQKKAMTGRGGPGRGGGRKLESGAKAIPKTVTMDPADIEFLTSSGVGDGELSRGIRRAAQVLREKMQRAAKKALPDV